jgi:hypothetical protein
MQSQSFWDAQFEMVNRIDRELVSARKF